MPEHRVLDQRIFRVYIDAGAANAGLGLAWPFWLARIPMPASLNRSLAMRASAKAYHRHDSPLSLGRATPISL